MSVSRYYDVSRQVKLPESVDSWALAEIIESVLRHEVARWQSYRLRVEVTLAEDDGLVTAGSVPDARAEADRTQSRSARST